MGRKWLVRYSEIFLNPIPSGENGGECAEIQHPSLTPDTGSRVKSGDAYGWRVTWTPMS